MAGAFQAYHLQPRIIAETQPKSNHNKNPKAHQITNQVIPTKIKAQNPQNNQNHKMKNTESEPTVKKIYIGFVIIF